MCISSVLFASAQTSHDALNPKYRPTANRSNFVHQSHLVTPVATTLVPYGQTMSAQFATSGQHYDGVAENRVIYL
ncbi:hypothetical protein CBM2586_A10249 [Cupriavidus phytorum]|uniref:Uncharacterized protein n=1 Tax=Cupriavidus taiwanensis TaxID=164546 RepID=A0A375B9L4_9BURK|nr:hypothetical protein CBM2586_A10249 [Cupriavidus taiwanensis]